MDHITTQVLNLVPVAPEIFVLVMACICLLLGAFAPRLRDLAFTCAQVTLIITAALIWLIYHDMTAPKTVYSFGHSFVFDYFAVVMKIFICLTVFFVFLYSRNYNLPRKIPTYEFYVLGLLSTLGMMVLISSHNILTLFMGVELMSLPTYAMVAMWRDNSRCVEAAMKYFIIGAVATGMLLYGLSMIFGATQQLDIVKIAQQINNISSSHSLILILGLIFVVAGVAFKMGAAPFHMWVPDVYDGAPTSVTLFISTAPKVAAFALAIRLITVAMAGLHIQWQEVLIVISVLSMLIGNFAAIVQTNIKRMLAYSSIAHMGYMLLGLLCATPRGYTAAMMYTLSYSIMTMGAFGMILMLSRAGFEAEDISDFAGFNNRNPWLAFMMLVVMFSLAGIPPLIGFIAKVSVLEALINSHLVWLAVLALIFAIVGAYYYLRVVKVMYFDDGDELQHTQSYEYEMDLKVAISLNGIIVLLAGIFPSLLFSICSAVSWSAML